MRRRHFRSVLAMLAVLIATGFALPAAPAFAATCSRWQCDGKNPHTTGCDANATTYDWAYIIKGEDTIGIVEYRWSFICSTSWSRVTSKVGPRTLTEQIERDDVLTPGHTTIYEKTFRDIDVDVRVAFSPMAYYVEGLRTQACGWIGSYKECTDWLN